MNIWINGAFDVLTYGHIKLFEYARALNSKGNIIVGIDSSRRITEKKGYNRPFHNTDQRIFNLKAIKYINEVVVFDSDDELENLIKKANPRYMVIGHEYKDKKIIGKKFAQNIVFFDMPRVTSTTEILKHEFNRSR